MMLVPCDSTDELPAPSAKESWRLQGVSVIVRRELCKEIRLGAKVTVIGVPTHKLVTCSHRTFVEVTFEVSAVFQKSSHLLPSWYNVLHS